VFAKTESVINKMDHTGFAASANLSIDPLLLNCCNTSCPAGVRQSESLTAMVRMEEVTAFFYLASAFRNRDTPAFYLH